MDLTPKATRDAFGDALMEIAASDARVVALTADLGDSLRLTKFGEMFKDRFFDVGVAEQNMMGIAAGLALDGKIPFAASFAVFSPGRNWDQIRVSVAYNNANVKIIGGYVGFSNGKDGATHQALEDIALMRVLPNMVVLDPADYEQTFSAMKTIYNFVGPVYLRIRRDPIMSVRATIYGLKQNKAEGSEDMIDPQDFKIGGADVLKNGNDVTIIATGAMVNVALHASVELAKQRISARVINLYSIKPINREIILAAAQETSAFVTVEEHQYMGGMGSAVAEVVVQDFPVPMKIIGSNNIFGETGTQDQLLQSRGLTVENVVNNVISVLKLKKPILQNSKSTV